MVFRFFSLFIFLILSACKTAEKIETHDPKLGFSKTSFDEKFTSIAPSSKLNKLFNPPKKEASPPAPFSRVVSLTVTEEAPLKDVFLQLAQQAEVNISLDQNLSGGATLHAIKRPFIDIIRELCRSNHLRYRYEKGILRVEPDTPYLENYNIKFLTITRENQNRISIATDVFTAVEGRRNDIDNGSNTLLSAESKSDFWAELEQSLQAILSISPKDATEGSSSFTLHKQGGIASVFATQSQHEKIKAYLDLLKKAIATQVLIEAKIVEVTLKDEFKSGINWNSFKGDFVIQSPLGRITTPGRHHQETTPERDVFTIGGTGRHLTGLISFMEKFGTVRTLSSPRLTVMNNQSAILKVATNRVFFRIDYNRDYGYQTDREREHVSSEVQTIPIGLVMLVHPSINAEDGSIIMTLRPTISRVVNEKPDPAVAIVSKQAYQSFIPEVQVRELDSVLHIKSGEIAIMGGLMEERSDNDSSQIPEAGDIPFFGMLFKSKTNDRNVSELVIFLKATIIDDFEKDAYLTDSSVDEADKNVYQSFTRDPRPLTF